MFTIRKLKLRKREEYLNKLISFKDTEMIKVITGIRRCGKSSLMKLMADHLCENGVHDHQIIEMNFESMEFYEMTVKGFYEYVKERTVQGEKMYLFFDEIQRVPNWQAAINSFSVDFDCDIYVTGSNAFLLSSELSTYLSGRYVEIKVLPLSFKEFIDFHGYTLEKSKSAAGAMKYKAKDGEGELVDIKEIFEAFVKFGGMPSIADIGLDIDKVNVFLEGVYGAVVVRDVLERGKRKEQSAITDAILLRKLIMFLADNIGNNTSVSSIGNTLTNEGLLEQGNRKTKPAHKTIQTYIDALTETYIFYEIKRFDIKGKEYLRTLGKYYIVDTGLRNHLLGFRGGDSGHILENLVYFELLRSGYDVAVGKIGTKEVDFIATKTDKTIYIQVTENMNTTETMEREFAPLQLIKDNFEKKILVYDKGLLQSRDGIIVEGIIDFLLN